jgi:hypothetical protein
MRKLFLLVFLINFGCSSAPEPLQPAAAIPSPAGQGSGQPNLTAGPDGRVYLSWLETLDSGEPELRIAVREAGGTWNTAGAVAKGLDWFVNYADFPSVVALADGALAAHWSIESDGLHINVSISKDGGRTWGEPVRPHRDGTPAEHGLVTLMPAPDGGVGVIWLDGRKGDTFSLMYTTIGLDGTLGEEVELDANVCECCQTSAAQTPNGPIVVYRDRTVAEIRDISLVRLQDAKWSPPEQVSKDGWEIFACPINGPSISSAGSNVAVAWFTAPGDMPQVNAVVSSDGGQTFGSPILIAGENSLGRVSAIALDNGDAIVSWIETAQSAPDGAELRARRVRADGTAEEPIVIAQTSSSTSSGFPRMARSGSEIVIAYIDTSEGSQVKTSVLTVED